MEGRGDPRARPRTLESVFNKGGRPGDEVGRIDRQRPSSRHWRGNRTMFIDLHVHTRHYSGCSNIEARGLIERVSQVGLDGVVLTEHGILWKREKMAPLVELAEERGLLLLAGQEVTCFYRGRRQGDFLVFGLDYSLGSNMAAQEMIERVHAEGGVVVAAHPYKPSRLGVSYYGAGDQVYELQLDALELYHPEHDEAARRKVKLAAGKLGIPMTGGSDAHELYHVGVCCTRFKRGVATLEDLVEALRKGEIEPVNGVPGRALRHRDPERPADRTKRPPR